jgi:hypothetical protein
LLRRFQLNQDLILDQDVSEDLTNDHAIVENWDGVLRVNPQVVLSQVVHQHPPSWSFLSVFIRVHLWLFFFTFLGG